MPLLPKRRHAHAGLRVQRHELIADRDVEDPLLLAVGPVGEAAARELPRRRGAARAFALAVHPQLFAGFRIDRDDGAPGAGGRIQHAVGHQRRRFEHELRPRSQMLGLEAPGDGELAEVGGVDLIERRVRVCGRCRRRTRATRRWRRRSARAGSRAENVQATATAMRSRA